MFGGQKLEDLIALAAMGAGPLAGKSPEELEALKAQSGLDSGGGAGGGCGGGAGGGGWSDGGGWSGGGGGGWGAGKGGGGSWGGPDTPQKLALVDRVKEWQRKSPAHKISWDNFCLMKGSDKFDPSRKAEDFLQEFMTMADAGMINLENPDSTCSSQEKQLLVDRVKHWQRMSPSHKQAWWTFCWKQGSKDFDPARHNGATLQMFLTGVDKGEVQPETPWMDLTTKGSDFFKGKGGKGEDMGGKSEGKGKGKDKGFMMFMFQMMKGKMKGKAKGAGYITDPMGGGDWGGGGGGCGGGCAALAASPMDPAAAMAMGGGAGYDATAAAAIASGALNPDELAAYAALAAAGGKGAFGAPPQPSGGDIAAAAAFAAAAASAPQITKEAEIRMEDAIAAKAAVDHLNGTSLMGGVLTVEWDTSSGVNTKLVVKGIPAIAGWQEVKDHFKAAGTVAFAKIKGEEEPGGGKGGGRFRGRPY